MDTDHGLVPGFYTLAPYGPEKTGEVIVYLSVSLYTDEKNEIPELYRTEECCPVLGHAGSVGPWWGYITSESTRTSAKAYYADSWEAATAAAEGAVRAWLDAIRAKMRIIDLERSRPDTVRKEITL